MKTVIRHSISVLLVASCAVVVGCRRESVQTGFRGLGIQQVSTVGQVDSRIEANQSPAPLPPVEPGGQLASDAYKNVQVLGNLSVAEFTRLMASITTWVAPTQGCAYCHGGDLASDEKYTKVVARRMLQMTQNVNANWQDHVRNVGVTCYTCHRGQPVPQYTWYINPGPTTALGQAGNKAGQNTPTLTVGLTSLPYDPFTAFLSQNGQIRVQSKTALPSGDTSTIQQTEQTYGLMIHISNALGVNCTYCHNSRSFMPWEASSPARLNAYYAIRMVRQLNQDYIGPLASVLPANRKGPEGDSLKANCATCHQGVPKPLLGVSLLQHYPELAGPAKP
jgi:photosynthetic reaction center cytochrome c subunit